MLDVHVDEVSSDGVAGATLAEKVGVAVCEAFHDELVELTRCAKRDGTFDGVAEGQLTRATVPVIVVANRSDYFSDDDDIALTEVSPCDALVHLERCHDKPFRCATCPLRRWINAY